MKYNQGTVQRIKDKNPSLHKPKRIQGEPNEAHESKQKTTKQQTKAHEKKTNKHKKYKKIIQPPRSKEQLFLLSSGLC